MQVWTEECVPSGERLRMSFALQHRTSEPCVEQQRVMATACHSIMYTYCLQASKHVYMFQQETVDLRGRFRWK